MENSSRAHLQQLMAQKNLTTEFGLARAARVPERQIHRLSRGLIHTLSIADTIKLAQYFELSVDEFLSSFLSLPDSLQPIPFTPTAGRSPALEKEIASLEEEVATLKADKSREIAALETEITTLKADKSQAITTLEEEIATLKTDKSQEIASLEEEVAALKADKSNETSALEEEIAALKTEKSKEISDLEEEVEALKAEYERLEKTSDKQSDNDQQQWQQEALDQLEPWLLQWSAAANAATTREEFPAKTLVSLAKPFDELLASWDVTPIGEVGEEVTYDPTIHQLIKGGFDVHGGDTVTIQNVGYTQGDRLLHRAKVIG